MAQESILKKKRSTLDRIMDAGRNEFIRLGFKDASLRNIVKRAGVTTGAFYGYFPDKEALFKSIVEPSADELKKTFINGQEGFKKMSTEKKAEAAFTYANRFLEWFIDFIYENFTPFKLIICCSEGTAYSDYVDSLIRIEVDNTLQFIEEMNRSGKTNTRMKPEFIHILSSSYFHAIFETVVHNMRKKDAEEYIKTLSDFFSAGWQRVWGFETTSSRDFF